MLNFLIEFFCEEKYLKTFGNNKIYIPLVEMEIWKVIISSTNICWNCQGTTIYCFKFKLNV